MLKHRPEQKLPADTPPKIISFYELVRQEVELNRWGFAPAEPVATPPPDTAPDEVAELAAKPTPLGTSSTEGASGGGIGGQIVTGSGMLAIGVAALGVAAVVAGAGELLLALPTADAGLKTVAQYAGLAALGVAVLPALTGAGLLTWGLIE